MFLRLARPYRGRFVIVAVLAFLGTAAELAEPLIYRIAVNDVAGVFVQRATEQPVAPLPPHAHSSTALLARVDDTAPHVDLVAAVPEPR